MTPHEFKQHERHHQRLPPCPVSLEWIVRKAQQVTTIDATFWLFSKSMIARLVDLISNSMDKYL